MIESTADPVQQFDARDAAGAAPGRGSTLWEVRPEERSYALLDDPDHQPVNRYGQKIDLLDLTDQQLPAGRPLYINENPEVGCNPNRNKQHGFYFNADNCIGCHACEAACAEKNETPPHLAFRSVGYVEGGSWPDYARLNISMACNHCDDPVCLKGCPTAAYTKHAEYGAVLQDPDTCFGCGYCTWVCPYNAPQLDPIQGEVSKCNMCVDRLEVGLKPACVSACVGNALDFGVIENVPANREQANVAIPGFPDPEITHPNIRFQQKRSLPDEMRRTDSVPVKYRRNADGGYAPMVDRKLGDRRQWNLAALSSRENVLVAFTLAAQAGIGLFGLLGLSVLAGMPGTDVLVASGAYLALVVTSLGLVATALLMSTVHLGKSLRFYRGFNNLKYSPVSREGLGITLFLAFGGLHLLAVLPSDVWLGAMWTDLFGSPIAAPPTWLSAVADTLAMLAVLAGTAGLYFMVCCYRIPARPFWNHWQVATAFAGTALVLGGLLALALAPASMQLLFGAAVLAGLVMEAVGLRAHARAMDRNGGEGAAAHYVQNTRFGWTYVARNVLLGGNVVLVAALLTFQPVGWLALAGWLGVSLMALVTAVVGRALFYVLVVPTTMPGAFFWKNPGFQEHAREVGLAEMPQVGVVAHTH